MKNNKEIKIAYLLSFIIPIIIYTIVCIIHGIYPFGKTSIMTGDITYQFIDYLAYFKSVIFENNDFVYTFSKTMGGDMAGFASYYLSSPFNLLLVLCPNRYLPAGLLFMIMLKTGLMSLSMFYMLTKLYGYKREAIAFSVSYSLMGYAIVYFQLYAYFDSLILLPIIIKGIHDLLENSAKKSLYIFTLFLAICVNYYVGWMLCIFSFLYFVYQFYIQKKGKKEFISFVISSVIAGAGSSFILIPALLSLRGEKNSLHLAFYRTMNLRDLFSRLYLNSFKGNISSCLPNIYCGTFITLLVVFYMFNKKFQLRERIASLIFILFLVLNLYINTLNIVWHGLNRPIGFPYRYSFLLTVLFIIIAYRQFINMTGDSTLAPAKETKAKKSESSSDDDKNENEEIKEKKKIFNIPVISVSILALFAAYSAYLIIFGNSVLTKRDILLQGIFLIVVLLLYNFKAYFDKKALVRYAAIAVALMAVVQTLEIAENMNSSMNNFEFEGIEEYQTYIDEVGEVVLNVKNMDHGFYRMEKYFKRSHNDAMQFGYNGLSHYSSCEKKDFIDYLGDLGFRDNGNWSFYDNGNTEIMDDIFGVKYVLSYYNSTGKPRERKGRSDFDEHSIYIYEKPYALPMMFSATTSIFDIETHRDDPFKYQNQIADSINGKENHILVKAEPETVKVANLTAISENGTSVTYKKNSEIIQTDYDRDYYIRYFIPVTAERAKKIMVGYFGADGPQDANIRIRDMDENYFDEYHWGVLDFGEKDEGKIYKIAIVPNEDTLNVNGAYFYFEDYDAVKTWYEDVIKDKCTLEKITSSHLMGTAEISEDKAIVFSFPYEDSWKLFIDGKKTETKKAAGALLGADITSGKHTIELKYIPAGRDISIWITILVAAYFIYCILIPERVNWS